MPHTKGPWALRTSTMHIVSTVEHEEYSPHLFDKEEPIELKRVICIYGAMGDNSEANLALMIAAPKLLETAKALLESAERPGSRRLLGGPGEPDTWVDYEEVSRAAIDELAAAVQAAESDTYPQI